MRESHQSAQGLRAVAVYDDRSGVQHIFDSSITQFDFVPVQDATIYAYATFYQLYIKYYILSRYFLFLVFANLYRRSSKEYYTCRVLGFTEKEVLVKWDVDGEFHGPYQHNILTSHFRFL
jgi:hypothetical protein